MDAATEAGRRCIVLLISGVIVAHALTEPTVDDATIGIDLIATGDDAIARVTADAAYETVAFYAAAEMRDATGVVPPSKTARVEKAFFRHTSILGDRLRARSRGGRVAESVVACTVLNQMTELGRPESYSIGRCLASGLGSVTVSFESCTSASDHVHVLLGIPPKLSVANTVGFLKGKSAIRIHREYLGRQRNFTGYHFWARGYCVSTVGVAEEVIRDYIRKQEADEKKQEKLELG